MQLVHHQLILPLGEAADGKAVVPIEADGDVQVLHLRQENLNIRKYQSSFVYWATPTKMSFKNLN